MESNNLLVISTAIDALSTNIRSLWLAGKMSVLAYTETIDKLTLLNFRLSRGNFTEAILMRHDFDIFLNYMQSFFITEDYFHVVARCIYLQLNMLLDSLIPGYIQLNSPPSQYNTIIIDSDSSEDEGAEEIFRMRAHNARSRVRRMYNHVRITSSESSSDSDSYDEPPPYEEPPTFQESTANLPDYDQSQREHEQRFGARPRMFAQERGMQLMVRAVRTDFRSLANPRPRVLTTEVDLSTTFIHDLFNDSEPDSDSTDSDQVEPADEDIVPTNFIAGTQGFTRSVNALGLTELVPIQTRRHGAYCPGCRFFLPHCSDFVLFKDCCQSTIDCCAHWNVPAFEVRNIYSDNHFIPINAYEQVYFYKKHLPNR